MTPEEAFVRLIAREEAERIVVRELNELAALRDREARVERLREEIAHLREVSAQLRSSEARNG